VCEKGLTKGGGGCRVERLRDRLRGNIGGGGETGGGGGG